MDLGIGRWLIIPLIAMTGVVVFSFVSENFTTSPGQSELTPPAPPPRVNFLVQIVLPQREWNIIDLNQLNADLLTIHRQSRQPLAHVVLTEVEIQDGDFRLTIFGHRWNPFLPPRRLRHRAPRQIDWIYQVRHDWAPIVRTRLANSGSDWTRLFVTTEPRINLATSTISHSEVRTQANTTQLRRWILNYMAPETNPDNFR